MAMLVSWRVNRDAGLVQVGLEPVSNGSPTSWMMGMEFFTRIPGQSETNGWHETNGWWYERNPAKQLRQSNEIRLHSVGGDFASLRFCKFAAGILPSTLDVVWCSLQAAITANVVQDVQQQYLQGKSRCLQKCQLNLPHPLVYLMVVNERSNEAIARCSHQLPKHRGFWGNSACATCVSWAKSQLSMWLEYSPWCCYLAFVSPFLSHKSLGLFFLGMEHRT